MPSYFEAEGSRVSLSAEVPRGHWAGLLGRLLTQRLLERLRYAEGVTYSADFDVVPVGPDLRRLIVTVDGLPDRMQDVATGAAEVLHELGRTGPTRAELESYAEAWSAQRELPTWVLSELNRVSDDHLIGQPSKSPDQLLSELRSLSPEQVSGFVRDLTSTTLWSVPPGLTVPDCQPAPVWSSNLIPGRRFTPPRGQIQASYVQVSDEGLSWASDRVDGPRVSVPWSECAAVVAFEDGSRRIVGLDGQAVTLFPERWDHWEELRDAVDARVPNGRWAPQRRNLDRARPQPPVIQVQGTSDAAWITVGVACMVFTTLLVVASQASGLDPVSLLVLLPFAGLSALPLWHVRRRRARVRAGTEPVRMRRYRGVASWPTRFVVAFLAVASVLGILALAGQVWAVEGLCIGAVVMAGRELRRRSERGREPPPEGWTLRR